MTALLALLVLAGPSHVTLKHDAGKYQLLVNGKPNLVKGAGGDMSRQLLVDCGGNSFRTWGAEDMGAKLDEAQKLGLKVTVGIWLGHLEHGFKYDNAEMVNKQLDMVKEVVQKYKDHPAVLMWGLGNEMEGDGSHPEIWTAVEDIAHAVKKLDPNHPTMTVIAELGDKKITDVQRMCPSVDIVGVNSYGGSPSVYERYVKQGGTKPYILTEFGPLGPWESPKTPWDRPIEMTSTQKEEWYQRAYQKNVVEHPELCLGSYTFLWGNKQEATATWFGMFLHDGTKTGAVDVLKKAWTGKDAEHPCPRISPITVEGDPAADPGDILKATVKVTDPKGDPLKVTWTLTGDSGVIGTNGDKEDVPDVIPGAVVSSSATGASVKMPKNPGMYRLFAIARNAHGGAAVANIPVRVRGAASVAMGGKATLPFSVYSDAGQSLPFNPSGWMGNAGAMKLAMDCAERPHGGRTCIKWDLNAKSDWGAIAWLSPDGDWGDRAGGFDLTGAKKLTYWARGAAGGEDLSVAVGIIPQSKTYFDTAIVAGSAPRLSSSWQRFEIDLTGKDLRRIKTGFVMTLKTSGQAATVYLDDVRFE